MPQKYDSLSEETTLIAEKDFPCIFIYPIAQKGNFHILRFRHPSYHHTDILRALIRFGQ